MNRDNIHPCLQEPPITHSLDRWDCEKKALTYEYNGRNIITIKFKTTKQPGYRMTSDVCMQSFPMIQQIFIELEEPESAEVIIVTSGDTVNMKPLRAQEEQGILGQVGRPLIYGVNGIYDIKQDLLIAWHGADWSWLNKKMRETNDGDLSASFEVKLGPKAWLINIYPQYYRTHLGYKYHKPWQRRPRLDPIAGWCSWEAFRRNINSRAVEECCTLFENMFGKYGLEYIQVDDGYEKTPVPHMSDRPLFKSWLETDSEKFPDGHKGIVDLIKAKGFKPGIWTHSSVMNEEFAKKFSDCIIKDNKGDLLEGDWAKYIFDCSSESISRHVLPLYEGLHEAGYEYVKVDALRHLLYDGLHEAVRQGILTNDQAEERYRRYLQAIREGLGEEVFFLACWGTITEAAGVADACRIAQDSNPNWPGIRMQLVESARWFHTNRILFINDPDHICARTKPEWLTSLATLVSLSGGLYMLSDPMEVYDSERIDIIRKTLPPLSTMTAETGTVDFNYPAYTWTKLHGFFVVNKEGPTETEEITMDDALNLAGNYKTMNNSHPFSSLWAFHLSREEERWCVAVRIATIPLAAGKLELENISLNPNSKYIAFDFWKQKALGIVENSLEVEALSLGCCQVIGMREVLDRPQFMASTRHVSMDAVSLQSQTWDNNTLILYLDDVAGTYIEYSFHVPAEYELFEAEAQNADCSVLETGEYLKLRLYLKEKNARLALKFK